MFNQVQPVFNQFGAARDAYGQIWLFLGQNGHVWAIWAKSGALTVEHCFTQYIQQVLLKEFLPFVTFF